MTVPGERRVTLAASRTQVGHPQVHLVQEKTLEVDKSSNRNRIVTRWRADLRPSLSGSTSGSRVDGRIAHHSDGQSRYCTIRAKSSASRLAPPTSAPSMSG
jgi:hypothetical protein